MRTVVAMIMIVLGVIGLAWGGITYVKDRDTIDLGIAEITTEEKDTVPIPPIVSGLLLVGGASLLVLGRRRTA
jgi:hypothetical protein